MVTVQASSDAQELSLAYSIEGACRRIAPTWPLDRFIAVNPYWGFVNQPIAATAAQLFVLCGTRMLMPRAYYREKWRTGHLLREHLQRAIAETASSVTPADMIASLDEEPRSLSVHTSLISGHMDAQRNLESAPSWRSFITNHISQHCAAYFDRDQAAWGPDKQAGLYPMWRRHALADRSPRLLMGLKRFGDEARELPVEPLALIAAATQALAIPAEGRETYFTALLLSVNGWAAWCAYERWQARLAHGDDDRIVHLLAIRLAWEWMLVRTGSHARLADRPLFGWSAPTGKPDLNATAFEMDWLLQRALEIAYQEPLLRGLARTVATPAPIAPAIQAVFCIDVRSEVFRRALEASNPRVQTFGFAGFFGLPIAYSPIGTSMNRPQLPGLLTPTHHVTDVPDSSSSRDAIARRREQALQWRLHWHEFRSSASSVFTFVETCGLLYAGKLMQSTLQDKLTSPVAEHIGLSSRQRATLRPSLSVDFDADAKPSMTARCELAAGVLVAMGLREHFAPLVLLAGHGSQSANNPHASGLDCGACGGQTGEVNARVLASLLNERAVRAGLATSGWSIPESTVFVAGLHNTTTDEVTLHDVDHVPASHAQALIELKAWLVQASVRARTERATALGLGHEQHREKIHRNLQRRACDWAEIRPEWGLADNAAFVVAPRGRTRHLNLAGRAFLHDYRWQDDAGFGVLELIMTAPMLVTNWINMQYFASTVDNQRYGSGNKLLHNVVGGRLGVFEGNGGDLRIGLPWQSLYDGATLRHTPLRLSVVIEAPSAAIDSIIGNHVVVRHLLDHDWLHLFRIDSERSDVFRYCRGTWIAHVASKPLTNERSDEGAELESAEQPSAEETWS